MKSGNLNFLEPSGPLQACNGTALHSGNLNFLEPSGPLQACNGTDLPLLMLNTIQDVWTGLGTGKDVILNSRIRNHITGCTEKSCDICIAKRDLLTSVFSGIEKTLNIASLLRFALRHNSTVLCPIDCASVYNLANKSKEVQNSV